MIHKEVECCLEDCLNLQHLRDMERGGIGKRAYAIENTERSNLVQDSDAELDENVVVKGCSYYDVVTVDRALLFGQTRR
jgi:hypothetical protein